MKIYIFILTKKMIKIKKSQIPNFLKKSHVFEGFDENLDEELEFEEKNFKKKDLNIETPKDYINLLRTVDFFLVEIPNEIIDFENNVDNEDEILKVLIKNKELPLIMNRLTYFKTIISERNEILNFSTKIFLSCDMGDLEDDDEEDYSKNPKLTGHFCFKNKLVDYKITFESDLEYLINFFKSIQNYKQKIIEQKIEKEKFEKKYKQKFSHLIGNFFDDVIEINYYENKLNFCSIMYFQGNEITCKSSDNNFTFEDGTRSIKNFLDSITEILLYLEKFKLFSKEKNIMGGYDESGELCLMTSVFDYPMRIEDFLSLRSEEINQQTGKKFSKENLEKWLIKNKRIFNIKNCKLFFTNN